jgi:hypothetical protein
MSRTLRTQVALYLDAEVVERLRATAKRVGRTQQELLREAITDMLAKHTGGAPRAAAEPQKAATSSAAAHQAQPSSRNDLTPTPEPPPLTKPEPPPPLKLTEEEKREQAADAARVFRGERSRSAAWKKFQAYGRLYIEYQERLSAWRKQQREGNAPLRAAAKLQKRRRVQELHPDKLGREHTAAERTEYVRLTRRRRKHK